MKLSLEITPRLSTGLAVTARGDDLKQLDGQGGKRRWTAAENKLAKVAKRYPGGKNGKPAAMFVESGVTEDEDEVVFIKEVIQNEEATRNEIK